MRRIIRYAPLVKDATKRRIMERDRYTCQYCGAHATVIDHIIPRDTFGSSNRDDNLVASCVRCNLKLTDKQFSGFSAKKLFIWNYLESIGEHIQPRKHTESRATLPIGHRARSQSTRYI